VSKYSPAALAIEVRMVLAPFLIVISSNVIPDSLF
jgi:hypothetical protein